METLFCIKRQLTLKCFCIALKIWQEMGDAPCVRHSFVQPAYGLLEVG